MMTASVCLSVCLSIYLSIYLSIQLFCNIWFSLYTLLAFSGIQQQQEQRYAVLQVHAGSFRVSGIHRPLTWTTESLTCVRDHIILMCAFTHGGWAHLQRVRTPLQTRKQLTIVPCASDGVSNLGSLNLESDALPIEPCPHPNEDFFLMIFKILFNRMEVLCALGKTMVSIQRRLEATHICSSLYFSLSISSLLPFSPPSFLNVPSQLVAFLSRYSFASQAQSSVFDLTQQICFF